MTVLPLAPLAVLEGNLARAAAANVDHEEHCDTAVMGGACDQCVALHADQERAEQRLEAARSQVPDRAMPADGALRRRFERELAARRAARA